MSQDITIKGNSYSAVKAITLPSTPVTLINESSITLNSNVGNMGYYGAVSGVSSYTHQAVHVNVNNVDYDFPIDPDPYDYAVGYTGYGAPYSSASRIDYSNYPFRLEADDDSKWRLYGQTSGTYTIFAETHNKSKFTDVTDTTAVASDVALNKIFYNSSGIATTGTNSGGVTKTVIGNFTTQSNAGIQTINVSYSGGGYPQVLMIYLTEGPYNSDGNVYDTVHRYGIVQFSIIKSSLTTVPTYTTNGANNYGTIQMLYKSSASTASSLSRTGSQTINSYSSSNPTTTNTQTVRIMNKNTFKIYVNNAGNYGFIPSTPYNYIILYSE